MKCANCGSQMITTYTRQGLALMICPHVKTSNVKSISGIPLHAEVHCTIEVKGLRASFEILTKGSTLTLEQMRQSTKETVNDAQLLEAANLALMLGLPVDELAALFECATQLGYATGISTVKAIDALCKGVGRRSRLILDNIGIAFKAKEAYDWFKREHKLEKLDESQRTEAWQKYALKLIKEKAEKLGVKNGSMF